jgi:hypothetical protein
MATEKSTGPVMEVSLTERWQDRARARAPARAKSIAKAKRALVEVRVRAGLPPEGVPPKMHVMRVWRPEIRSSPERLARSIRDRVKSGTPDFAQHRTTRGRSCPTSLTYSKMPGVVHQDA